ncbi:MAG: hypothetical protein KDJ65_38575, partial [Anaerolineae bacterium]|nr:hypothetical protein [Anaerolineae bacterium]
WRAIPHKNWTQIEFKEQKLEFKVSEDNDDISVIQDYTTFFTAESNQVTIFVTFWRKWANWRTGIGSVDCLALMPATPQMIQAAQKPRTNFVDLSGGTAHPSNAQPAAAGLRPDNQLPVTGDQSSLPPQPLEQEQPASAPSNQSHQAESDTSVSLEEQKEQPIEAAESSAVALETETDVGQSNVPPQSESLPQTETVSSAETENVDVAAVAPSNMGLDITSSPVLILFGAVVAAFAVVGVGLWAMRR